MLGETVVEANEAFTVTLSSPSVGAVIGTASAHGVIRNDDGTTTAAGVSAVVGGLPADTVLTGSGGPDTFVFDQPLVAGDITTIAGFQPGSDTIALAHSVFSAAGPLGSLKAAAFFIGAAAHDASDRIIYNPDNGHLLFDPDGNGASPAQAFATLSSGLPLTASNFKLI